MEKQHMRKVNVAMALVLAGSGAWAALAHAEKPLPVSPENGSAVKLADEIPEIQHLRETRKELNAAKDAFDKDAPDKLGHRKEILEGIDKAITAVDAEIDELKAK
jgi:hypothetical protein